MSGATFAEREAKHEADREADRDRCARAWQVLHTVPDPEVPALSVCDLGIVRDVLDHGDALEVVLTPTYSGCPATEVIEQSLRDALAAAGIGPVRVTLRRAPAWTTDWISAEGRRKLHDDGIAPPGPVPFEAADGADGADRAGGAGRAGGADRAVPIRFHARRAAPAIACPRCTSHHTERLSAFGSTACKAMYRCLACREPFEHFKPI